MTMRIHLFPSRTQKLSSWVPKILGWRRPGKIGRCRHKRETRIYTGFLSYCSLAQSVEHAAVNRGVVSSSLTGAAKRNSRSNDRLFLLLAVVTLQLAIPCFGRRTAVNWSETDHRQWRGEGGRARRKQGGMEPGSIPATRPTMFSTVGVVSSSLTGAAKKNRPHHMAVCSFSFLP